MDFSYYKFQKFVLILFYLVLSTGTCSANLYGFSTISGLIVFTVQVSLGEGTVISKTNSSKPFTISQDATGLSASKVAVRDSRILKDLSKLNRQGCLAKMLCGIEVAKVPSDATTSWNDYAYLVKTFFDTFSFSGLTETASSNDDESDPPTKRTRGSSKWKKRPPSMAGDVYREQSLRDKLENEQIEKMREGLTLEELVELELKDDHDGWYGFRRRTSPARNKPMSHLQIKNPRFDKTMYLDRKQREFSLATDEAQKLTIAKEVGSKFRRGRQCRALFNTGFSFCPWEAKDLQDLLLNRTTYTSSLTTTTTQRSYTLADSPYQIYDSYSPLLEYQDDEFPTAFINPSTVLVETEAGEVQPNGSAGKGFLTYDPNTDANVFSYLGKSKSTTKKPRKKKAKKPKPESKETSRESSEEAKDIDSGENSTKQRSEEEEEHEESIENGEPHNSNLEHDETTSDEDPDSTEGQDDEEDDYKSWSESKESSTTEKPKRIRTKPRVQKNKTNTPYSVTKEALKFQSTKFANDYVTVAQNFVNSNDRIISQERYLTGLPSVWDPNKEKWKYPIRNRNQQNENKRNNENENKKSKESESSEEDEEDNENNTKELEEKLRFNQMQRRVPPPRPLIRFRIPKFRGRRSIDYFSTAENEGYLSLRPLPPEISV